ncbi:hypothetical protein INS49_006729 [Diaporthe citri]|uniref:uncharacterized protein n=1 Tax=Diaporthe citri TaxID=83186 RepID=UPI001C80BCE2|nr:uncharacterized protein INS49_006729 [Diaporthe citri]KAG6365122.1 hypothetical protein INS49_006729 [Diaporthe citri]
MAASRTSKTLSPIIITGGCGFVGSHLVEALLKEDASYEIHVIDIHTERNRFPGVTYHSCDIASPNEVDAVFSEAKPRTVFHTACPDFLVLNPSRFQSVNVGGTQNLLVSAKKINTVQAFIYTSSSSVIHDNISNLIDADDTLPVLQYPAQKRVYTLTKARAEAEVLAANRENDSSMLTASIRPVTAFGERDFGCMGKIVAQCRAGRGNVQIGSGDNLYDFTYITNLADAHILAAHALVEAHGKAPLPPEMRVDGETFIITNDEPMLFWEFQRAVAASVDLPIRREQIRVIPRWLAMLVATLTEWATWIGSFGTKQASITREAIHLTTITRTLKCDKAKRILGYNPRISIDEGLQRAGKWFIDEARKTQDAKKRT